jgi:hypothetical protein
MSRCVYLSILLTYPIAPQGQSPQTFEWQKKKGGLIQSDKTSRWVSCFNPHMVMLNQQLLQKHTNCKTLIFV